MIRRWLVARFGPWLGTLLTALACTALILAFLARISARLGPFRDGHL
jgi:hypothetical protein